MAVLITGVAPHSLGEALVQESVNWRPPQGLVCVDLTRNRWLEQQVRYHPLELNLNPLQHSAGFREFGRDIKAKVKDALWRLDEQYFSCVIQCSGVYWSGSFLESKSDTRERLYGVNLLGHIELLHTIMQINSENGVSNNRSLSHIEIGSLHGLQNRTGRSLYSSSKSASLDFSASLATGEEVYRLIYFAPGPIDTFMLHHNHWVVKAKGPEGFLQHLNEGDRGRYRAITIDCSETAFREYLAEQRIENCELLQHFRKYMHERTNAQHGEPGLLSAADRARLLSRIVQDPAAYVSGVYLPTRNTHENPSLRFVDFAVVDRNRFVGAP